MADSRVSTGLTVEQWDDKYFTEYLTENRFAGEMGTDENSIIQVKENLTKKKGDALSMQHDPMCVGATLREASADTLTF